MSDRKTGEEGFPCRKHKNKHLKLRWSLMDGRLRGAAWGLNQTSFVSLLLLSWPSISVAVQAGSWSYVRPASGGVPCFLSLFGPLRRPHVSSVAADLRSANYPSWSPSWTGRDRNIQLSFCSCSPLSRSAALSRSRCASPRRLGGFGGPSVTWMI